MRIFTVGVGTPEGSLIPIQSQNGGTAFVKDSTGQVVKSKLDEKRLREIAETTGGIYLPLENGPRTMKQLFTDGLAKMQAGDIDARMARQPIERYQWPLAAAIARVGGLALDQRTRASPTLVPRQPVPERRTPAATAATALLVLLFAAASARAAAPGLDAYRQEKFGEAYNRFQETLKEYPDTKATDKIQFDAGAAAYKMKDYNKALQSFSQALLSPDLQLQSRSHYNLGNTLYQRGEAQKKTDEKLKDWTNALQHYEQTLKIEPENKEAKDNYEYVKNKIEELKKQQEQPSPTPTPSPSPQDKKDQKKQDQQDKDKKDQQDQSGSGDDKKPQENQDQSQEQKDQSKGKDDQQKPGQTPTPSPLLRLASNNSGSSKASHRRLRRARARASKDRVPVRLPASRVRHRHRRARMGRALRRHPAKETKRPPLLPVKAKAARATRTRRRVRQCQAPRPIRNRQVK